MATAAELVARCIAPVKREYLRVNRGDAAPAATAAAAAAGGGAAAPDAAAAGGAGAAPAAAVERKSKNQTRRDIKRTAQQRVCQGFLLGACAFGADCRYGHDVAGYLATKAPDLAGDCPLTAGGAAAACPYGITCRWATKHGDASGETARAAAATAAAAGAEQQAGEGAAAEGPEVAPAASSSGGGNGVSDAAWLARVAAEAGTSAAGLPPLQGIQKPSNALDKGVQHALWKDKYDFSRADGVLRALGLQAGSGRSRQGQQHGGGRGGRGRGGGRGGGRGEGAAAAASSAAQQTAAVASAPAAAAGEQGATGDAAPSLPSAKRAKTEGSSGGGGGGGTLEDLYASEDTAAGAGVAAPAAEATAAASTAAAVAPAQAASAGTAAGGSQQQSAAPPPAASASGAADYVEAKLHPRERKKLDLAGKTYLAPLTTVGNLPFRRLCKDLGCEVTCGEMALATNLLQGQASEWALLKRHASEDIFGVQVCGGYPDAMARLGQLISEHVTCDFVDLNCGCPIDIICNRGAGSALPTKTRRFEEVVRATSGVLDVPLIVKMRKGYNDGADVAHELIPQVASWGASAVTLHGRTRQQRYSRQADWDYIERCGRIAQGVGLPFVGNGDVMSYDDWQRHMAGGSVTTCMIGRGALIKPWIFTEIREQRLWDISAGERFDQLRQFCSYGLEHWGSDTRGVEATRRFLLEWLSFTHRYVPVGLLEVVPQAMNWRPPAFAGRNELETLLASEAAADWVRISEMLLGPAPPGFSFAPKHKSNAYVVSAADAGLLAAGGQAAGAAGSGGGGEGAGLQPQDADDVENG